MGGSHISSPTCTRKESGVPVSGATLGNNLGMISRHQTPLHVDPPGQGFCAGDTQPSESLTCVVGLVRGNCNATFPPSPHR